MHLFHRKINRIIYLLFDIVYFKAIKKLCTLTNWKIHYFKQIQKSKLGSKL